MFFQLDKKCLKRKKENEREGEIAGWGGKGGRKKKKRSGKEEKGKRISFDVGLFADRNAPDVP